MPNDYITLKALSEELNATLKTGRINKINSDTEELTMLLRAGGKNCNLVLSAGATPRVFLSYTKPGNGDAKESPTTFCMLLRKHLTGGEIKSVRLLGSDRVMCVTVLSRNELHDEVEYNIVTEIFSNGANVILTDDSYKIIDAMKRVFGDGVRCLMTGYTYNLPPQNKPSIENADEVAEFDNLKNGELKKALSDSLLGFSKETLVEIVARSQSASPSSVIAKMLSIYNSSDYSPCVFKDEKGNVKGYYICPYSSVSGDDGFEKTESLSRAIELYFAKSAGDEKKNRDIKNYLKTLKKLRTRAEKRIEECQKTIDSAGEGDRYLVYGEIIKCNLHQIPRGVESVTLFNFYTNEEEAIKLNPTLSPIKNAEAYFKKYNKIKGAEKYATQEIQTFRERLNYLDSIYASLLNCDRTSEYKEIENELLSLTGKRGTNQKTSKKEKPSSPLALKIDDFQVYIGKNNKQNDEVTFKLAVGGDIWLHTKDYHGSHGVIVTNGKAVPNATIMKVASIVAYFSTAAELDKVQVDYTSRKFVKKAGSPGLVHYTNYSTVVVKPQKP